MRCKKLLSLLGLTIILGWPAQGQLNVTTANTGFTIDFESSLTGVNNSEFDGSGFAASPAAGQLDADAWAVEGFDVNSPFGTGSATDDMARGASTGGVSTGGVYAFDHGSNNVALGIQPGGDDFTPGSITLRIVNNSGSAIASVEVDYVIRTYNDEDRANSLNLSHSTDNVSYTSVNAIDFTSVETAAVTPAWTSTSRSTAISGLNIPDGSSFYLRWTGDDVSGSGGRDEFAIDDITVNMKVAPTTYTFNGTWTPANPDGISITSDNIIIASGNVIFSNNTFCNNITIEPGAALDVGANTLTVDGTATLQADATGYAQVIGNITGTSIWESYLSSSKAERWFNVSIPVSTALSNVFFTNSAFLQANGTAAQTNIYKYDATEVGVADGEGDWEPLDDLTGNSALTGYSVYLGGTSFGSLPTTMSVSGDIQNGNISKTIEPQSSIPPADGGYGWNFVANPYPSCIDWHAVVTNNPNITTTYWIYNEDGQWMAYNEAAPGVTPGPAGGGAGATGIADRYIAPGQAFFIQSNTATGLNFTNSDRVLNQSPPLLKSSGMPNSLTLTVENVKTGNYDFTFIAFTTGDSDANDRRKDGIKKFNDLNMFPAIYTTSGNFEYTFNFTEPAIYGKSVELGFEFADTADFIVKPDYSYLDSSYHIELEDRLTGQRIPLTASGYSFSHRPVHRADRFVLHVNQHKVSRENNPQSKVHTYVKGEKLNIKTSFQGQQVRFGIYDLSGKLICTRSMHESTAVVDMSACSPGVYILRMYHAGASVYTQKFIKK